MKRQEMNRLDDESLIWACMEPIMTQTAGKEPAEQAKLLSSLNDAQRAMFLFQIFYGHADSGLAILYDRMDALMDKADLWTGVEIGLLYFNDEPMLEVLKEMEKGWYQYRNEPNASGTIEELSEAYRKLVPETQKKIADYIRKHPSEFLKMEGWSRRV